MKKIFAIVAVAALFTVGCGDKDEPKPETGLNQCYAGAPDWVINGGAEGGITAVGSSRILKSGQGPTRTMALGSARNEMARSINVKVNNMMKSFTQSTGIGDDEVVDTVVADVSKQISSETLQGTRQRAIWQSPCDELYVLIEADPSLVQNAVKNGVNSSYRNDNALWQQFQAQKAQDELDAAIRAEFSR